MRDLLGFLAVTLIGIVILADRMAHDGIPLAANQSTSVTSCAFPPTPSVIPGVGLGLAAPEIIGTDLAGKPLRLREFFGKVVVLDFWDSSTPAGVSHVPSLRELVQRHQDDPFVMLGISCDRNATRAVSLARAEQHSWRSWNDSTGRIRMVWPMTKYPTTILIDHEGIIRGIGIEDDDLEDALLPLLIRARAALDKPGVPTIE